MATLNRDSAAFAAAMKTLADAGENVAEEKIEQILGQYDLGHLLGEKNLAGTLARTLHAIPPTAHLVGINLLASYIDVRKDINPALKFAAVSFLRALPQAIPNMFAGGKTPTAAELETELGKQKQAVAKPQPAEAGRAFQNLADFKDDVKRQFIQGLYMLAENEILGDQGLGLEGRASHIVAALTLALDTKDGAKGLEDITPSNQPAADELFRLSELTREEVEAERATKKVLIPLKARRFIADLLVAYQVAHPISHTQVRAGDWADKFWSWAPASLRPKRPGLAGVREVAGKPLGLIFLVLITILLTLIVIAGLLVVGPTMYIIGIVLQGMFTLPQLFSPHMSEGMFTIQKGVAAAWLLLVLLPIVGTLNKRFDSDFRPRVMTLRIVLSAVGLVSALLGWGAGWFMNTGATLVIVATWLVLLTVEFSNKFGVKMTPAFVTRGMERFVSGVTAVGVLVLFVGILILTTVRKEDGDRLTVLSEGLVNESVDKLADWTGVAVPSSTRCEQGLAALEGEAAKVGLSVARICEFESDEFPCTCL